MNLSRPFVERPIATILLTIGIALAGIAAFFALPVSPLPKVDFPVISVSASLAGASPDTMASSIATPLERRLGTIAGVNEMTSTSSTGSARVTLQFDLNRDINGAAREVQAAINAARVDLPATLRSNPTYRKINPASSPVIILALTSKTKTPGQIYDAVSNIVSQRLSQVQGVGDVEIGGGSLPAVRVELLPFALNRYGISTEDVRAAIQAGNANRPKGAIEGEGRRLQIYTPQPARRAAEYRTMIVAWRNGAAVRLADVANVVDGVENRRTLGLFNGEPAIIVLVTRQPSANIIETVDRVRDLIPELRAQLPQDIEVQVASDSTNSIRSSLHEIELTLMVSIVLVVLVVGLFLRKARATVVPAVATVVSLLGTFGVMYLLDFSLNNLSLMALTVATGFVVDDAIVVLENTMRHIEAGMDRVEAALQGAREVGFTVLSISLSLVAVFIPILLMGSIVGRLFREFAVTLSVALGLSMIVSLSLTPVLCVMLLRQPAHDARGPRLYVWIEAGLARMQGAYLAALTWVMRHRLLTLLSLLLTVVLNVYLYATVPKGFFPAQDTGVLMGAVRADQNISFQALKPHLMQIAHDLAADPDVEAVMSSTGSGRAGSRNTGDFFIRLKDYTQRTSSAAAIANRLTKANNKVAGIQVFLTPAEDIRVGGRSANAAYQFSLQADDLDLLRVWEPKVEAALRALPELTGIDSDSQTGGQELKLHIDRSAASRLGVSVSDIDNLLNNAYSQRQVSTIYDPLNQYQVVMEVNPKYALDPITLEQVQVITADGARVPLSTIAHYERSLEDDRVTHEGQFASDSISFDLADGVTLDQATAAIERAVAAVGLPEDVIAKMAGTADAFAATQKSQPWMILGALVAVYLVLGILYESYIHPLTILSTLPSAGVGALLSIYLTGGQFSLISLLGLFLLIGVVKKNAILMIDLALQLERGSGMTPMESIRSACLQRLRPILMTTLAAILGAVPLLLSSAEGAEMRRPLGLTIIGGLILSQILTLYTTPVVYLYLDRLRHRFNKWRGVQTDAALETPL